jgi:hypothetical protein
MLRFLHAAAIAALCTSFHPAFAEPVAGKARHARFLALGDSPPFRQEIRDGVRYELDPPSGSIPPREVIARTAGKASAPVPLGLGRISPPVPVPPGVGPLQLQQVGDNAEAAPWVKFSHPETGDFLVLLWRNPETGLWRDVKSLVVAEVPAGSARVVNLFPQPVRMLWGAENMLLPAGATMVRAVPRDSPVALRILTADATGRLMRYYSGGVSANADERSLVVTYRADGENPRRPLKVSILREPALMPLEVPK